MALGAIAALEAAGKVPGKDVLICSIDGERDGVQAIIDGKIGAICECSPFFGPVAFDTAEKHFRGEAIPPRSSTRTGSTPRRTRARCCPAPSDP